MRVSALARTALLVAAGRGRRRRRPRRRPPRQGTAHRSPRRSSSPRRATRRRWRSSFGVHRALDTTGAMLGPLLAFLALWAVPDDYRLVFVISLAAAVIGVALLALLVPDLRPAAQPRSDGQRSTRAHRPARPARRAGVRPSRRGRRAARAADPQRRLHLPGAPGPQRPGGHVVPAAVRRHQPRLPRAGRPVRTGRRPARPWPGDGRSATSSSSAPTCAPPGLRGRCSSRAVCLLLLGAFYASTDGVLAAAAASRWCDPRCAAARSPPPSRPWRSPGWRPPWSSAWSWTAGRARVARGPRSWPWPARRCAVPLALAGCCHGRRRPGR